MNVLELLLLTKVENTRPNVAGLDAVGTRERFMLLNDGV